MDISHKMEPAKIVQYNFAVIVITTRQIVLAASMDGKL
jgi:hypothetical protein